MSVAILRQGDYLIASIQSDLSDREVIELRHELAELVGRHRSRGIVIDVAALDVIDSFVARSLRAIVLTAKPARRRGDHRRYPAGRGHRDGAVPAEPRATPCGSRPRRRDSAARSPDPGGRRGWRVRSASRSTPTTIW